MSKRSASLDNFFSAPAKSRRVEGRLQPQNSNTISSTGDKVSTHPTYPFAVSYLSLDVANVLDFSPADEGRKINDQPHLDLVYYQPYISREIHHELFEFYRSQLFFYRVKYAIKRGSFETLINTPRFTTVFGLDETSLFTKDGNIIDAATKKPVPSSAYKCKPRPIPQCLDYLRKLTENATGCKFNFALVNYYATGNDSISYHSDDERFLGPEPAIASFTLGAKRDFLMRHKRSTTGDLVEAKPLKLPLGSGDMVLMRGLTQSEWEHSIPKRKGGEADRGRINITFRRAMVKGGTENYYRYNVGDGPPLRWCASRRDMIELAEYAAK